MFLISFFAALIACFFATLAGGGAGLILQPVFILSGLPYINALASAKLAVGFIGISSSLVYFRSGIIDRRVFWFSATYGLPFVILGTCFSDRLPGETMKVILGVFILLAVIISFTSKLGLNPHNPQALNTTNVLRCILIMTPIAFYSGWLSAGTGIFLTLMYISVLKYDQKHATAMTISACGLLWNGVGAVCHLFLGHILWDLAPALILGALIGSYLGAKFSLKQGNKVLKNIFLIVAIGTALSMLLK